MASTSGALEREPDPADAEERVGLGRHRQRRQRLVGAGVERAHDERAAVERDGDLAAASSACSSSLGQLGAVEEQELGAEQPDALGAELDRVRRLARPSPGSRTPRSGCRRGWRPVSCARSRARARRVCSARSRRSVASRCTSAGGSTWSVPASPSSSTRRAVGRSPSTASPSPTTAGRPERPGEDRGVRGGGAVRGSDPGHAAPDRAWRRRPGSARRRSRFPVVSDRLRPGLAGQSTDHAPADVEHVRGALLEQRLLERAVALGDLDGRVVATRARRWRRPRSRAYAGSSSASSSSSTRCASKIAASALPARAATVSRSRSIAVLAVAIASPSRAARARDPRRRARAAARTRRAADGPVRPRLRPMLPPRAGPPRPPTLRAATDSDGDGG